MAGNSSNGKAGCGAIFGGFILVCLAIYLLVTLWWLLMLLAVAMLVAAFVYRKRRQADPGAGPVKKKDPTYTQKCENCGAQIEVSVYDEFARCEYCGCTSTAERTPRKKPDGADDNKPLDPFAILIALAIVFGVAGIIGLALGSATSKDDPGSSANAAIEGSSASATVDEDGSNPEPDEVMEPAEGSSDEDVIATEDEPRDLLTDEDFQSVEVGDYVRISGSNGSIVKTLDGVISVGVDLPNYEESVSDHRLYGISVNLGWVEGDQRTVHAPSIDPGEYVELFASRPPVDFSHMEVTISGHVGDVLESDYSHKVISFTFDDCVLENLTLSEE